jgi:anti-sigma factor RsiW
MSLCQSIETLSMAFLDDELAVEERRELELHLLSCATCRQHVDSERGELELVRKALIAPPAPELLKARIARALDAEDGAAARRQRRRWSQWMLPGSAMAAAAAAILLFVGVGPAGDRAGSAVANDVTLQQGRDLPFEVRGASTGPWLRANFAPVEPPRFTEPGIELLGARLLPNGIAHHDAALLSYEATIGDNRIGLTAVVVTGLRGDELNHGEVVQVGDKDLWVHDANGMPVVTYSDPVSGVGYVFCSRWLAADELVRLVVTTDLIGRAQHGR